MKIGNKKIVANKKIVSIATLLLVLTLIGSVSYAYFTASVMGNDTAKDVQVEAGTMSLNFDGTAIVGLDNALPGASHKIKFSVENTGSLATTYSLDIVDVVNTFVQNTSGVEELVYTITRNDKVVKDETAVPKTNESLLIAVIIESGAKHSYELTIHFKETGSNQNGNQGAKFSGLLQINNLEETNYLASRIIGSNAMNPVTLTSTNYKAGSTKAETGIYSAEDDEGTSYYLRGLVENNYIDLGTKYKEAIDICIVGINGSYNYLLTFNNEIDAHTECDNYYEDDYGFASAEECKDNIVNYTKKVGDPLLWRVVRINGDGSIRLIADDMVGTSKFNEDANGHKYVGYTYDNGKICTSVNPCDSKTGTSSTIKAYLESWYETNKNILDGLTVESSFCSDTTIAKNDITNIDYGADDRWSKGLPTFKCLETPETYGGKYKLKVGLLTADEMIRGGFGIMHSYTTYLFKGYEWWSMSPADSVPNYAMVININNSDFNFSSVSSFNYEVRPVINIKADAIITSGYGTQLFPYTIK